MSEMERIGQVLRDAEASHTAVGPVSDLIEGGLTLDQAHSVCEENIARREAAGQRIVGYKVGFTNIVVREKMGLPDSTYGYLMAGMVLESGGALDVSEFVAPRIESEICDARIRDWKCPYPDFFADNGFLARNVPGGTGWVPIGRVDLLNESVVISRDGSPFAEGRGEMALGSPANAVAWLANKLSDRGRRLTAGMLVMTGTLTPITPITAGSTYVGTFSTLGAVEMTFA